jgi:uncharacterized membrane protein YoaK (UPF0700 family)
MILKLKSFNAYKLKAKLAFILAMIAGYVDAYGYLSYNTYLSFMSGNTTQTGVGIAGYHFSEISSFLISIFFFVTGVIFGTLFSHSDVFQSRRLIFFMIAAIQAIVIGFAQLNFMAADLQIAFLSFTMGLLNTVLGRVGAQMINLTFVTGILSRFADHIAMIIKGTPLQDAEGPWDTHAGRALLLIKVWFSFLLGACFSGFAFPYFEGWSLFIPICILLSLALIRKDSEKELLSTK